ncbi:MAG: hypothetical protein ACTSX1_03990 [Candidatus Heimdallarchaeaceae archaeon]
MHLYPRFEHRVVGTYDKAVEYIQKVCQYDRETDRPQLPALVLNPSGEFDIADANAGGKQLWRFPNLAPGMIKRIFDPVYQDANNQVHVGFIRMQGDIELIMLLNSFYEYCDLRMLMLQIFGGYERWIYPQFFTTFVIIPEEFINYEYDNPFTGLKYKLDWESAGAYERLVKTTAKNELVVPCNIKPTYKLTAVSDASSRYGGTDNIADWRLGATIRYEIEIPSYMVLESDWLAENAIINIQAGSAYSVYSDYSVPTYRIEREVTRDLGLDQTSNSVISDATCSETAAADEAEYYFHTRYYHFVDQAQADSTANVSVTLPEPIADVNSLIVVSKYGEMEYGDHYTLTDWQDAPPNAAEGYTTMVINIKNVDLEVGMVIELYIYKRTN